MVIEMVDIGYTNLRERIKTTIQPHLCTPQKKVFSAVSGPAL